MGSVSSHFHVATDWLNGFCCCGCCSSTCCFFAPTRLAQYQGPFPAEGLASDEPVSQSNGHTSESRAHSPVAESQGSGNGSESAQNEPGQKHRNMLSRVHKSHKQGDMRGAELLSELVVWAVDHPRQRTLSYDSPFLSHARRRWLGHPSSFSSRRQLQWHLAGFARVDHHGKKIVFFTESQWNAVVAREPSKRQQADMGLRETNWKQVAEVLNGLFPSPIAGLPEDTEPVPKSRAKDTQEMHSAMLKTLEKCDDAVLALLMPSITVGLLNVDQHCDRAELQVSQMSIANSVQSGGTQPALGLSKTEPLNPEAAFVPRLVELLCRRAKNNLRLCSAMFWALEVAWKGLQQCQSLSPRAAESGSPRTPRDPGADRLALGRHLEQLRDAAVRGGAMQSLARQLQLLQALRKLRNQERESRGSAQEMAAQGYCGLAFAFDCDEGLPDKPAVKPTVWRCVPEMPVADDFQLGTMQSTPEDSSLRLPEGPLVLDCDAPWVRKVAVSRSTSPAGPWQVCASVPLWPDEELVGLDPDSLAVCSTALAPMHCQMLTLAGQKRRLLFKDRADLRRDQLVTDITRVIDHIWKKEGLDLRLSCGGYTVVPTSTEDGMIEVVPEVRSLTDLLRTRRGLAQHLDTPERKANWVRSNAGCAVLCYVLGLGDRHLDNMLVNADGCLFHIDFGPWILGRDPKPGAPLVKIRSEMVDVMGGVESENFRNMLRLAEAAYIKLREHWALPRAMLRLAADVQSVEKGRIVHSLTGDSRRAALDARLVEADRRLCLTEDRKGADLAQHIRQTLVQSVGGFWGNTLDSIHGIATRLR
eukprot:TRINITY_DN15550_c0_g2_i1.p1 TRINITY_DN15550_c0_g2~~TRINITY_DN15550_c0_g2_i1.p1  ORF type:complete len:839 (+),score=222.23 TRINITY_DN15550_c0_g2_i1:77-2518(+)